jgi:hypothetical protein
MLASDCGLFDDHAQPCFSLGKAHRGEVAGDNGKTCAALQAIFRENQRFESKL